MPAGPLATNPSSDGKVAGIPTSVSRQFRYLPGMAAVPLPPTSRAVVHLGEFIDTLALLRGGHIIVVMDPDKRTCVLDGMGLQWSFRTLEAYALIAEFRNPRGFEGLRYYRLTETGRDFADRALAAWRAHSWHQRLMLRLRG